MSEAGSKNPQEAARAAKKAAKGGKDKSAGTQVAVGEEARDPNYVPRFKKRYHDVIKADLIKQFGSMAGGRSARQIATEKAKHDPDYQERVGIVDGPAKNLAPELAARIQGIAKRIYRTLGLDGYARIDFRLAADGTLYFIEANPNPEIAKSQEFATAAQHDGLDYPGLLHRIVTLGINRAKAGVSVG